MKGMTEHFEKVLNVARPVNMDAARAVLASVVPRQDIDWPAPTREQILSAIKRLKCRKAPGPDGIPAELYRIPGVDGEIARPCMVAR